MMERSPSVDEMRGSEPWTLTLRALLMLAPLLTACDVRRGDDRASSGGTDQHVQPASYGLGRAADSSVLATLDIDANPAGAGLPPGQGTSATGSMIFAQKCAMCHGPHGEGLGPYPRLIGVAPPAGFAFATDVKAPKTIGNYWPYATTLYDYVHRAMPFTAPGSLTPSETYSVVAYLLSQNGIITAALPMNAHTLPAVRMPARSHFVADDRTGGATFR